MDQQPIKKPLFPLWTKITIGIILALVIIALMSNPESKKTAGAILCLIGIIGFLWSGVWLIIDLFFTAHEKIIGSTLYKFLTPARKKYFAFFLISILISFLGGALVE
ncbi:MAG: hypothetical protein WBB37_07365 [bacterium]